MDKEEDAASGKKKIRTTSKFNMIQDLPDGNDSELDRNQQEDDAVRGESSNAITCINNIEIINANNVVIGDHTVVRRSGERMNTRRIAEVFQAMVETGDRESVDEETQISSRPVVTNNIIVRDSDFVAIGDNIEIYPQNSDEMFTSDFQTVSLEEALNFDQHRRTDQLPLRSELSQLPTPGLDRRVRTVFKIMSEIVDQLYPLRDCGKRQEFENALNRLHQKYDSHPEIKCFLLMEESVTLTYEKNFKAAKKKAKESLNNVRAIKIDGALQDVLTALANIALASIYRRLTKKELGNTEQCLQNAMESGER
ncbi:hypothetical protein OS493_031901 [Desmophyllum pertusum]|uniref:Uncharacterized protein n=1 Tax=Desmophyllum pertusum TaxID=174260 RepID=A0A9W9ZY86_9CNID|nr:hypothetical protein OS493_031901 [Desmophyllum pertusum]